MKAVSAIILLFLTAILMLALYDTPSKVATITESPVLQETVEPAKKPAKKPLSVAQKKKRFIEKTLPAILRVKAELDEEYEYVLQLSQKPQLSPTEQAIIETLKLRYNVKGIPCLLKRMRTHPVSIVLAQAALETGWGTSRFYNEANNIFGIWSYNAKEPRLAAGENRGEKTIYVKKYSNLEQSIEGYFRMMATGHAYSNFRDARLNEQNPFKLIPHLGHYSELRDEYVKRLYHVIRSNRFYHFDTPSYKPIPLTQVIPDYVQQRPRQPVRTVSSVAATDDTAVSAPLSQSIGTLDEHRESDPVSSDSECTDTPKKKPEAPLTASAEN
jgi:Bax protein